MPQFNHPTMPEPFMNVYDIALRLRSEHFLWAAFGAADSDESPHKTFRQLSYMHAIAGLLKEVS